MSYLDNPTDNTELFIIRERINALEDGQFTMRMWRRISICLGTFLILSFIAISLTLQTRNARLQNPCIDMMSVSTDETKQMQCNNHKQKMTFEGSRVICRCSK